MQAYVTDSIYIVEYPTYRGKRVCWTCGWHIYIYS